MNAIVRALAALALSAAAVGCTPTVSLMTPAAPARELKVSDEHSHIELSEATALGLETWYGGSCKNMRATSEDPQIARVMYAHLNRVSSYDAMTQGKPTGVALLGGVPGRTRVVVACDGIFSGRVSHTYDVVVDPAPAPRAALR